MLDVRQLSNGARVVVLVVGEVDLASADDLTSGLDAALATEGITELSVDLSGVEFLDSTGVRALVMARRGAHAKQVRFSVCNPQPWVARVLDATGVGEALLNPEP